MEQVTRIGLVTKPWQGLVLPLNYTCKLFNCVLIFLCCLCFAFIIIANLFIIVKA